MKKPNILTVDPHQEGVQARVPRLGARDPWKNPVYEVGGKLAVRNLHAVRIELVKALRAGFKKRDLLVFVSAEREGRIFLTAGFCTKYMAGNYDVVGDVLDRYAYLKDNGHDDDMIYIRVDDRATCRYEVGFLDQPKRVSYSTADMKRRQAAIIQSGQLAHPSGLNRRARRAAGLS
jgi:hypothetical protein